MSFFPPSTLEAECDESGSEQAQHPVAHHPGVGARCNVCFDSREDGNDTWQAFRAGVRFWEVLRVDHDADGKPRAQRTRSTPYAIPHKMSHKN
jgi:hypothetical protein